VAYSAEEAKGPATQLLPMEQNPDADDTAAGRENN